MSLTKLTIEMKWRADFWEYVPRSWILSVWSPHVTPSNEMLRELKDGVCRVLRDYQAHILQSQLASKCAMEWLRLVGLIKL